MDTKEEYITFDGQRIMAVEEAKEISLKDFANKCFEGRKGKALIGEASHVSPTSPPPFMAGIPKLM